MSNPGAFDPAGLADTGWTDEYDVFLSFTWSDADDVDRLEQSLRARGLRVFRDRECIPEFDGITDRIARALASTRVLLAYYSTRYPTRHACQWELTAAFLAGQREGDPRGRVLVVNPATNSDHVRPIELEDARYFPAPHDDAERRRLADRVAQLAAAATVPMGASTSRIDPNLVAAQVRLPREILGRYLEMWQVHGALHTRNVPATSPPTPAAVAMVTGFGGIGKTSMVRRYAYLFRDFYPGGVFWTGPLADAAGGPDDRVITRFRQEVVEQVARAWGLALRGAEHPVLLAEVAAHVNRLGRDVLWVVDDVPSGMAPALLDQLLVPSPHVHTVLTSRAGTPAWHVPTVEVRGLSDADGAALFLGARPAGGHRDLDTVRRLVTRCGGNPLIIQNLAAAVRHRPDLVDDEMLRGFLDAVPEALSDALRAAIGSVDADARLVLGFAAALAAVPFPATWASSVVGPLLGADANARLGSAMAELSARGLLQAVNVAGEAWTSSYWQAHPLVAEMVRPIDPALVAAAATVALAALDDPDAPDERRSLLLQHASVLASHAELATTERVALLSAVIEQYRRRGDLLAAQVEARSLREIADGAEALLRVARVSVAAGDYADGYAVARRVIDRAESLGDHRNDYRARLVAGRALDALARYPEADAVRAPIAGQADGWTPPAWLSGSERLAAVVDQVSAYRLRGRFRRAHELIEPALAGYAAASRDPIDDVVVSARLELARLQLLTGRTKDARRTTRGIVDDYHRAGLDSHPQSMDALGLQAEAELTVDVTETRARPEDWKQAEQDAIAAYERYARTLGTANPRTLFAAYQRDLTMVRAGRPKAALVALAETERLATRVLGTDHPLCCRLRYAIAQAHGQRREYRQAAAVLTDLLERMSVLFGPFHPDTLASELDLGIALAMLSEADRARAHIDNATKRISAELGWRAELRSRAEVTRILIRLPSFVWPAFDVVARLFGNSTED